MKSHFQNVEVVGTLYLESGLIYDLLSLTPLKHTDNQWIFKGEPAFSFYVADEEGIAKNVTVVRSGFVIVPLLPPEEKSVRFFIEEEEVKQNTIQTISV